MAPASIESRTKVRRTLTPRLMRSLVDKALLDYLNGPIGRELVRRQLRRELARHVALHARQGSRRLPGAPTEAIDAGQSFRQEQLATPAMLTSEEAAGRLGISREALNQKRKTWKVLGLEGAKRGVRYPKWQFDDDVFPSLPQVLHTLRHLDPWGHYLFFTNPEPLLAGSTPLDALRKGKQSEVLRVAELLAAEAAKP